MHELVCILQAVAVRARLLLCVENATGVNLPPMIVPVTVNDLLVRVGSNGWPAGGACW